MGVVGRLDQYASMLAYEFDETTANNSSITGLGTYYATEFNENVVDIVRNGLVLNLDAGNLASYPGSGTTWTDVSGNGNTGTLTNGPTYSSTNGGYLSFNGTNQYVIANNTSLNSQFSNTSVSHFMWIYPTGAGSLVSELGQTTINTGWTDSNIEINASGAFSFSTWHGSLTNRVVSSNLSFNTWYYVGFAYDGTTLTAYINGVSIGTTTFTRQAPYNNGFQTHYALFATQSQNMGTGGYGVGRCAAFSVYNRGLTAAEVAQNYNALATRYALTTTNSTAPMSANVFPPYDPVYDEFSGTSFGAGQGRYMRQNTDKSVIVYNEIDEISDFRDIVRSGLVLDLDAGMNASFNNTGTTWNDLSGNGNNGTLVLGPTYSSANGGSIVFDGTNDYSTSTSVTNSLTTLQKEGSLTYEYWIKPTASIKLGYTESNGGSSFYSPGNATPQGLSGDLAYNYGDGGSIYVGFGFAFGTNGFVAGVHKNAYAPTILVDYQTYNGISHLVVIKNATNCSYYVNGVLKKASLTIAGGATIIGDTMSFVANSAGAFMNVFKGDIYSVKFYNRALSAAEILQNYNALKHRFGL
jgi:hypothetical protein